MMPAAEFQRHFELSAGTRMTTGTFDFYNMIERNPEKLHTEFIVNPTLLCIRFGIKLTSREGWVEAEPSVFQHILDI